jgi:hypothetical protein
MRMVYYSAFHDAVAISPVLVLRGTASAPEIFSKNHWRIADKTVRRDDSIVESNHQECPAHWPVYEMDPRTSSCHYASGAARHG